MHSADGVVGSTVSLWRYPVKSMKGEELDASEVTERGMLGDRAYALLDPATGKIVSAKNPKKWSRVLDVHVGFERPPKLGESMPPVRVACPDSAMASSSGGAAAALLSKYLDRPVRFMAVAPEAPSYEEYWPDIEGLAHREEITNESMPARTFFDLAAIHLLTTATLDRLRDLYPHGRFEVRRFRPNIVVEPQGGARGFVEDGWIGKILAIGGGVRVKITGPCTRCVMTTLPQGDLPQDGEILRTVAKHHHVNVGVYASVVRGGRIRKGDPVSLA